MNNYVYLLVNTTGHTILAFCKEVYKLPPNPPTKWLKDFCPNNGILRQRSAKNINYTWL